MCTLQMVRVFFLQNSLTYLSHSLTLALEGRARTAFCVGIIIVYTLKDLDEIVGRLFHLALSS